MPQGKFTLLDLAARSGQNVHALVEGVITCAPELQVIPTFPKQGTTYETLTRTALPRGAFRKVGGGSATQKSSYDRTVGSMAYFEAQMRVPEDVVQAQVASGVDIKIGDILADEAIATVQGSTITIGAQTYYGTKIDADGFSGLSTFVDPANVLDAGGATGVDTSSVYLIYVDNNQVNPQGVHFLLGSNGRMSFRDAWGMQQVEISPASGNTPAKYANAYVNSFNMFLGLAVSRKEAVYQAKNVLSTSPVTDNLIATLIAKAPQALMQDRSKWKLLMNVQSRLGLQLSRTSIGQQIADQKGQGAYSPTPTESNGIEIVCTDSLIMTERNGKKP